MISLTMLIMGVMPTPPASSTTGVSRLVSRKNPPLGAFTSRMSPALSAEWKKLETSPGLPFESPVEGATRLIVTR